MCGSIMSIISEEQVNCLRFSNWLVLVGISLWEVVAAAATSPIHHTSVHIDTLAWCDPYLVLHFLTNL